ncbi:MAG: hypothetical protein IT382_24450 [Deltaproteobacteria bacterium]|nr:hypothetical protein [Deltaproteobacteria bacterium]
MTRFVDARPDKLVETLRRAHVEGASIALRAPHSASTAVVRLVAGKDARVSLDAHNGLAELDGALALGATARRLEQIGAIFPIARPLPPAPLAIAAAAVPYLVDAFIASGDALTFDGDPYSTPRAPRAAAGPALLYSVCTRPPLALLVRARVRVLLATHATSWREEHESVRAAAERVRDLVEEGRAFAVDACGTTVLVLAAAGVPAPRLAVPARFAHFGHGRSTAFAHSRSLAPGDAGAMEAALLSGARVAGAPFIGRAAALERGLEVLPVVDVATATHHLVAALTGAAGSQGSP